MEEINQLRCEVVRLSLAIRLGLVGAIAGFTFRACSTLAQASRFHEIFMDLFGDKPLPLLTQFYLSLSTPMSIGLAVLGVAAIVVLLVAPRQVWSIPVGIIVTVASIIVSETAVLAFQAPFLHIVSSLGK